MATPSGRRVDLESDGTVWSLGNNRCGASGNGTNQDLDVPAQASGLTGVVAISAGRGHTAKAAWIASPTAVGAAAEEGTGLS